MYEHDTPLLTVEEAAERLRVSRGTLYRYVRTGKIGAVRVGNLGPWRIPAGPLEQMLRPTRGQNTNHAPAQDA